MKWHLNAIVGLHCLLVAGCGTTSETEDLMPLATGAAGPSKLRATDSVDRTLDCMRETRALRNVVFSIGPWVDSTGKSNAVAIGATGHFLPQAGTATFVTDAINKAGGKALVSYFGPAPSKIQADYAINGIFNSLDFGSVQDADLQVMGIGPITRSGWAYLTMSIQLDAARTRLNRQMSVISRTVRYNRLGLSVGRVWGNTLVTGNAAITDQQRLQLEAINGPIALGVIDVLIKEFPAMKHCRKYKAENGKTG